jgi:hypothetical protein
MSFILVVVVVPEFHCGVDSVVESSRLKGELGVAKFLVKCFKDCGVRLWLVWRCR